MKAIGVTINIFYIVTRKVGLNKNLPYLQLKYNSLKKNILQKCIYASNSILMQNDVFYRKKDSCCIRLLYVNFETSVNFDSFLLWRCSKTLLLFYL